MSRPKNDLVRRVDVLSLIDVEIEQWKHERAECFRGSDRYRLIGEILKALQGRRRALASVPGAGHV